MQPRTHAIFIAYLISSPRTSQHPIISQGYDYQADGKTIEIDVDDTIIEIFLVVLEFVCRVSCQQESHVKTKFHRIGQMCF
jgi:hypothetical protein